MRSFFDLSREQSSDILRSISGVYFNPHAPDDAESWSLQGCHVTRLSQYFFWVQRDGFPFRVVSCLIKEGRLLEILLVPAFNSRLNLHQISSTCDLAHFILQLCDQFRVDMKVGQVEEVKAIADLASHLMALNGLNGAYSESFSEVLDYVVRGLHKLDSFFWKVQADLEWRGFSYNPKYREDNLIGDRALKVEVVLRNPGLFGHPQPRESFCERLRSYLTLY